MPSLPRICIKTVISSFYLDWLSGTRKKGYMEEREMDLAEHEIIRVFGDTVLESDTFTDSPFRGEASPAGGEPRGVH